MEGAEFMFAEALAIFLHHSVIFDYVRLRMRIICPDVLTSLDVETRLRLSEVLINLSLSHESPTMTSTAHTLPCTRYEKPTLRTDMEKQSEALLVQMTGPKNMRVLTHTLRETSMQSLDVLTGRCMELANDAT